MSVAACRKSSCRSARARPSRYAVSAAARAQRSPCGAAGSLSRCPSCRIHRSAVSSEHASASRQRSLSILSMLKRRDGANPAGMQSRAAERGGDGSETVRRVKDTAAWGALP